MIATVVTPRVVPPPPPPSFVRIASRPASSTPVRVGRERDPDADPLLARLRAGDDAAYEELVRRASPRMLATARRLLGDEEEARDAVQEAFLSAFRSIHRFEGGSRLETWLHRIVVNAALMRLRTRRRHPEIAIDDLLPRFDADGHRMPAPDPAAEPAEEPGLARDRERRIARVRACIDRLPERYRTVLVLRDVEEMSTDEAARLLGMTRENVKTRLHRARQALKTLLEADGVL
jgi:RNA polymerase sigma-70 factor (ECF subfamily)